METTTCEDPKEIIEFDLSEAGLRTHPGMKRIPESPEESSRFLALCADIEENGIRLPIPCTRKREIVDVDGRDRWLAARRVQCPKIPVIWVRDEEVNTAILTSMLHRRHFTRSALAYLTYPLMAAAYNEMRNRQMARFQGHRTASSDSTLIGTVEDFAGQQGFSRDLFFKAKEVHGLFIADPEYKALMEPRILAEPIGGEHEEHRPVGLWAVMAGYQGRKLKDGARPPTGQMELFRLGLTRFSYWAGFGEKERLLARQLIRNTVTEMPADLRKEFASALREAEKEERA